ncbi:MAG: T9SS type A sorting domain-containing protein, partial [Flavobacteriales bacterium]
EENSGLGIQASSQLQVDLFPNPANTEITLTGIPRESMIEMSDVNGKIWKSLLWSDQRTINVQELPAGLYLLKIEVPQKGIFYKKLIIERL